MPLAGLVLVALAVWPRTDGEGIPVPSEAVCRLGSARFRQAGDVNQIALTPDGRTLLTLNHFGETHLHAWELPSGRLRFRVRPLPGTRRGLWADRDGIGIEDLTSPEDRLRVTRYDPVTGRPLGHPVVYPVAAKYATLSADWRFILAHTEVDKSNVLTLHPAGGGSPVTVFREAEPFYYFRFGPGPDQFLVVNSPMSKQPDRFRVFELQTGKLLREWTSAGSSVYGADLSPDRTRLAATVFDFEKKRDTLTVWDTATGRPRLVLSDPARTWDGRVGYSPDGRLLAVDSGPDLVLVDPVSGRVVRTFRGQSTWTHRFARDGKALYVAKGSQQGQVVNRLDLATGAVDAPDLPYGVAVVRFGPGGRVFAVTQLGRSHAGTQLIGWDLAARAIAFRGHVFPSPREFMDDAILDVSPDGRWVVVHERSSGFSKDDWAQAFRICDAATGRVRATCGGHREPVDDARFSPDGRRVVSITKSGRRVWDAATGRELDPAEGAGIETDRAVSPDGRTRARWDEKGQVIELVETATGRVRHTFRGHVGAVNDFAFSPDGRYLAADSPDAPVYVWDVRGELSRPSEPGQRALATMWDALASDDAAAAFDAVRRLARFPEVAVPDLRRRLPPATGPSAAELAALAAALDAPHYADREAAERKLAVLGDVAGPALRAVAGRPPSAEARERAARLLKRLDVARRGADQVRAVRAVEALEWAGTPAARAVLAEWAGGAAGARLSEEARTALGRLKAR